MEPYKWYYVPYTSDACSVMYTIQNGINAPEGHGTTTEQHHGQPPDPQFERQNCETKNR